MGGYGTCETQLQKNPARSTAPHVQRAMQMQSLLFLGQQGEQEQVA
jgi:hypothetical protein